MAEIKKGICPITGERDELIFSNNPLVPSVGIRHLESQLDLKNLVDADFFCRTFNFPFDPNEWLKAVEFEGGKNIIQNYIKFFLATNTDNLYYKTSTVDHWKKANTEWEIAIEHTQLLEKIRPLREDFVQRAATVWGTGFTFEEYLKMESQFQSTVNMFNINNPMQADTIRKVCITSVMIDNALKSGDVAAIKDLTATHSTLVRLAKIDEMIEASQTDVIRTVADLAAHLEESGYEFKFYDGVERDVVDKTINDMKDFTRDLVLESTGLEQTFELIARKYQEIQVDESTEEAIEQFDLEAITTMAKEELAAEIDEQLLSEDILDEEEDYIDYGDDEDEFF